MLLFSDFFNAVKSSAKKILLDDFSGRSFIDINLKKQEPMTDPWEPLFVIQF